MIPRPILWFSEWLDTLEPQTYLTVVAGCIAFTMALIAISAPVGVAVGVVFGLAFLPR
jgi:hypothetical protein